MKRFSREWRETHDGNMVLVVWLRCRGLKLDDIARVMGFSRSRAHQCLKRAQGILDHVPPSLDDPELIRLSDLPIPSLFVHALEKRGIVMAKDLAAITVDKAALCPGLGKVSLGRLYLTVRGYGFEFHPSWEATINGQAYYYYTRQYLPEKSPVHAARGSRLQPYTRR